MLKGHYTINKSREVVVRGFVSREAALQFINKLHVCDDVTGEQISFMYLINWVCLAAAKREGSV